MDFYQKKYSDEDLDELAKVTCDHRYKKTGSYTRDHGVHVEFFECVKCGRARQVEHVR